MLSSQRQFLCNGNRMSLSAVYSTACLSLSLSASLLTSGCARAWDQDALPLRRTAIQSPLPSPTQIPRLYGKVPTRVLIKSLMRAGVVLGGQVNRSSAVFWGPDDLIELKSQLRLNGFSIIDGYLVPSQANFPSDLSDPLGRASGFLFSPRPGGYLSIRFRRHSVGGGLFGPYDIIDLELGASGSEMLVSSVFTSGVMMTMSNTSERSYFERASVDGTEDSFETSRGTVTAGVVFSGMIGSENDHFRITGDLSVSAFAGGESLDRAATGFPINLDAKVDQWITVAVVDSRDASARASFRALGWELQAGSEVVVIAVKVEPFLVQLPADFYRVEPPPAQSPSRGGPSGPRATVLN